MGAGSSVAQELVSPRHSKSRTRKYGRSSTTGSQYREMLEHLRHRFAEEIEVLRSKYGDVDQDALIVKLLVEEFSFTTVEVNDLPVLKTQPRDKGKVYLLGETHFEPSHPTAGVELNTIKPKALEIAGDEKLSAVAREYLPANSKTSKKAVELMGSTKVVTEKKALKRLGSEMTDSMKVLQIKSERKQKEEEDRKGNAHVSATVVTEDGVGAGASGEKGLSQKGSMANLRPGSPTGFADSAMARRATRLLTEVPKFIHDMGMSGGSKADMAK